MATFERPASVQEVLRQRWKRARITDPSRSPAQQRARSEHNELRSMLFRLPAELRVRIYEALASNEIHICWKPSSSEEDCLLRGMIPYRDTRYPCPNFTAMNVNGIDQPYKSFVSHVCRIPQGFQRAYKRTQASSKTEGSVLPYADEHKSCILSFSAGQWSTTRIPSAFELLRTCRSVYREAVSVFYSEVNLIFQTPACMNSFINLAITPQCAAMIQYVRIETSNSHWMSPFAGLNEESVARLSGLKRMELVVGKCKEVEMLAQWPVVPAFSSSLETVNVIIGSQAINDLATSAWKGRWKAERLETVILGKAHFTAKPDMDSSSQPRQLGGTTSNTSIGTFEADGDRETAYKM